MKSEEVPSARHGDISPINDSISNLPESQSPEAKGPTKRKEPNWESLTNFSRVTPAQFQCIIFSPSSRYQPVRPVSAREPTIKTGKGATKTVHPDKYIGGGGILLLVDERPGEPEEYIELGTVPPPTSQAAPTISASITTTEVLHRNISLDPNAPEADVPAPFEVSSFLLT
jgi:26S proteasome regulatory subunit N2